MASDGQGTNAPDSVMGAVRTVADIDLRPRASRAGGRAHPDVLGTALAQLRHTVRTDDRICPYSVSRIAVVFGPAADAVPPRRLGARLARAVGQGVFDHWAGDVGGRARSGDRRTRRSRVAIPSTTVVTVDRVFAGEPGTPEGAAMGAGAARMTPRRRQRAVVHFSPEGLGGLADGRPGAKRDDRTGRTVLVIDPDPGAESGPGLAAVAAADAADRLGYATGTVAVCSDEGLVVEIGGKPLDLVVLVIGPEPAGATDWTSSTWSIPARLTEAYRSKGFAVLAVSVGASLAAMTAAVEQGARAAYDLNDLRRALRQARPGPAGPTDEAEENSGTRPKGAEGFGLLTVAERRVLFSLTTGRSPQAIADD
ncbi:MAG: hypothetical protein JO368_12735, partial [Acidimicrobiales bacterium]|nr:hypothetical protein [Acidimicrobiales bacterium]